MSKFAQFWEAIVGTIWAAILALVVLASSILVQFGVEWLTKSLGVSQSKSTEYLIQVIDMTGAVGSGATFVLLTALQVIRLYRDIQREVASNEHP